MVGLIAEPADLAGTGSCWNCGFLCRRDEINRHLPGYYEITDHDREVGRFFTSFERHEPRCFADLPLREEIQVEIGPDAPTRSQQLIAWHDHVNLAATSVIRRDRQCPDWVDYRGGEGPQDRRRRHDLERLEEVRIANDLKIAELDRRSQEAMLEITKEIAKSSEALATISARSEKQSDRFNDQTMRFSSWFLLLAFGSIVLAVATLFFPDGLPRVAVHDSSKTGAADATVPRPSDTPVITPIPQ